MALLSDPIFQAVVLICLAIFIAWGRKRFGTLKEVPAMSLQNFMHSAKLILFGDPRPRKSLSEELYEIALRETLEKEARTVQPVAPIARSVAQSAHLSDVQSIKLSTLSLSDNLLVCGPKGSGKTTVLRTIVALRKAEQCIALDPHASPGKWPCKTIGGGLEWAAIDSEMQTMQQHMQHRFKALAAGITKEGDFPRRTYVGDEWLVISQELDGKDGRVHAGKLLISRLTQGRKVGECVLVASQNDTVEALGIKGNADLKSCFDYLIFLGGLIETRATFHGCPEDIRRAAQQANRPAVVWHPERNNWYVLVYDLQPVLEGEVLSVPSVVPTGSVEPVPDNMPEKAGSGLGNQYRASTEPVPGTDGIDADVIKALHKIGWSNNKIAERMKGRREDRLARIRAALNIETVQAA